METVVQKLANGNSIEYKIVNGTAYHVNTPDRVVSILERARMNRGQRIRIFYGNKETGKDWNDEYDTIGYIGRSGGNIKIPLLIKNTRSYGGGGLLDDCIVKITIDKQTVYQHENYHCGNFEIKECTDKTLLEKGYTLMVFMDGKNMANFKSEAKANNYILFMQGKRNRI